MMNVKERAIISSLLLQKQQRTLLILKLQEQERSASELIKLRMTRARSHVTRTRARTLMSLSSEVRIAVTNIHSKGTTNIINPTELKSKERARNRAASRR